MIPTNKKLVVLHPYLNKKGGASNMMIYLSNFLSDSNDVVFYTFSYDENVFPARDNNFLIKCFNSSKLVSFFRIAYDIRNSDYIFIGNSPMHFVSVISKIIFRSKAKLIWWHHHYPWYYSINANFYTKSKRFIEKLFVKNIDLLIANSEYLKQSIKDIYKIDSKILHPVLDDKFLGYTKSPLNSKNKSLSLEFSPPKGERGCKIEGKTIFSYGRWVEGKNLGLIFEVYEGLKDRINNLVLMIGGDGEEVSYYMDKYKDNKNIIFSGMLQKKQIIEHLEKSDLFLFPSSIDSFGLVLLESMSIGVPVISYNIFGAKEIVKDGYNGYLVSSPEEFVDRSYEVLSNLELQKNLSINCFNISNTFNSHTFDEELSRIFKSLV